MPLKLMYITNSEDVAHIAEEAGVDRIFVDMEYIGKTDRQGGMDTVQSRHTADDVRRLAQCLNKAELFVRVNPIHEKTDEYNSSKEEIDEIINSKLDIADSEVIISAWKGYLNGSHPKRDIINTPEYKNACDKISKLLEEKKNNSNQKESSAFYDMFNGYSPYDIDKAFEKLTDKQKNIILKKWNGDIKKGIKKRGEFTKGENTSYSLAKKALINILSGKEKNSNDKDVKKERSKNVLNEKQLEIKLDAKNEVNMSEDTKTIQEQEKIESKITMQKRY